MQPRAVIRIQLAAVRAKAAIRPPGYFEEVVSLGNIEGDDLLIDREAFERLRAKYAGTGPKPELGLEEPEPGELLANFAGAVARWAKAGFPVVGAIGFRARVDACAGCQSWEPGAFLGTGKCRACGCSKIKHWMATERCPEGKW